MIMAAGDSVATTNLGNPTSITNDNAYLVWSNDNNGTALTNSVSGFANATTRIDRTWKVDKTNFANQNITACFSGYNGDYFMLISSDATFGSGDTELTLTADGCVTFSSALLPDGAYFTLGKKIIGPACVNGGIQVWLRADGSVTNGTGEAAENGNAVNSWVDFSGFERTATQAVVGTNPHLQAIQRILIHP